MNFPQNRNCSYGCLMSKKKIKKAALHTEGGWCSPKGAKESRGASRLKKLFSSKEKINSRKMDATAQLAALASLEEEEVVVVGARHWSQQTCAGNQQSVNYYLQCLYTVNYHLQCLNTVNYYLHTSGKCSLLRVGQSVRQSVGVGQSVGRLRPSSQTRLFVGNWEQSCASSANSNLLYKGAEHNNLHSCNNLLNQRTILRILLECEHSDCSISPPAGISQISRGPGTTNVQSLFFFFSRKKGSEH